MLPKGPSSILGWLVVAMATWVLLKVSGIVVGVGHAINGDVSSCKGKYGSH